MYICIGPWLDSQALPMNSTEDVNVSMLQDFHRESH